MKNALAEIGLDGLFADRAAVHPQSCRTMSVVRAAINDAARSAAGSVLDRTTMPAVVTITIAVRCTIHVEHLVEEPDRHLGDAAIHVRSHHCRRCRRFPPTAAANDPSRPLPSKVSSSPIPTFRLRASTLPITLFPAHRGHPGIAALPDTRPGIVETCSDLDSQDLTPRYLHAESCAPRSKSTQMRTNGR